MLTYSPCTYYLLLHWSTCMHIRAIQSRPFGRHLTPFESCFNFDFDVGSLGRSAVNSEMRAQL